MFNTKETIDFIEGLKIKKNSCDVLTYHSVCVCVCVLFVAVLMIYEEQPGSSPWQRSCPWC